MAYRDVVLAESSLVAFWELQETGGTSAADSKGGRTGTWGNTGGVALGQPNGPWVSAGVRALAPTLAGYPSGGYVNVPAFAVASAGSISVEAWVVSSQASQGGSLVWKNPVNAQWGLFIEDGLIKWRGGSGSNQLTGPLLTLGQWYHVVATQSGTSASLYVNGSLAVTGTVTAIADGTTNGTNDVSLGRFHAGGNYYLNGRLALVAVYNAVLGATQVNDHYLASTAYGSTTSSYPAEVLADSPRGYWRLGEASGTTCTDSSGNGNHGTYGPAPALGRTGALGDANTAASFTPGAGGSQVTLPYSASLSCTTAWTIECLAYVRSLPPPGEGPAFLSDLYPGSSSRVQYVLGFYYDSAYHGRVFAGTFTGNWHWAMSPAQCPLNGWVHWAGVYDGAAGTVTLYQDGVQVAQATGVPSSLAAVTSNKWIGRRWDADEHPDAVLDEVALYGTALSAARIAAHHAAWVALLSAPRARATQQTAEAVAAGTPGGLVTQQSVEAVTTSTPAVQFTQQLAEVLTSGAPGAAVLQTGTEALTSTVPPALVVQAGAEVLSTPSPPGAQVFSETVEVLWTPLKPRTYGHVVG